MIHSPDWPAVAAWLRRGLLLFALGWLTPSFAAAENPPVAPDGTSVLLLTNGRVISGRIGENASGYVVQSSAGSVLVPFDRVRLRASNLHDVYRRLLSTFPNPSPETHVALAQWCLTQQLYDETKIELRTALAINPEQADARNMLRRLENILNPERGAEPAATGERQTADGFEPPPATSLAGLPREAGRDYVTRVQPLLMNSCALAGCHSHGAGAAFQLARVRIGPRSSRVLTERNLAATLQYVDRDDPDGSLLLTIPRGNHGRGGRPVFDGPGGDEHFQLLREWVRQVAPRGQVGLAKSNDVPGIGSPRAPAFASQPQSEAGLPGRRLPQESLDEVTGGDPLLEAILREERRDAFDPGEFNRRARR